MNHKIIISTTVILLFTIIGCENESNDNFPNSDFKILFISQNIDDYYDTDYYLYKMDFDGSNIERISDSSVFYDKPIISNNCNLIAFSTEDYDQTPTHEFFYVNLDNQVVEKIDDAIYRYNSNSITWSPDDKIIVFSRKMSVSPYYNSIYSYDFNSKQLVQLTNFDNCYNSQISPDGTTISFSNMLDLYTIDLDGSNKRLISSNVRGFYDWSPNNDKIVYVGLGENQQEHIFIMDKDGKDSELLTFGTNPTWTPDGKRIVYFLSNTNSDLYEIWIMNHNGTDKRKLVDENDIDYDISISPDSKFILYMTHLDCIPCSDLTIVDIETGKTKKLSNNRQYDKYPSFINNN